MKYTELKEMTLKEWDGNPFYAIVIDNPGEDITDYDVKRLNGTEKPFAVTGFNRGVWMDDECRSWIHAYPIAWFEKPKKMMSNRQLAMWLAKGNGQMMYLSHVDLSFDGTACVWTTFTYGLNKEPFECNDRIRVRKWGGKEWVEPTVDLLEDCK